MSYEVAHWSATNRTIELAAEIIWPGFITETPDDKVPLMTIALLYPASYPNGADYAPGADIKNTFDLAVD